MIKRRIPETKRQKQVRQGKAPGGEKKEKKREVGRVRRHRKPAKKLRPYRTKQTLKTILKIKKLENINKNKKKRSRKLFFRVIKNTKIISDITSQILFIYLYLYFVMLPHLPSCSRRFSHVWL